MRILAALLVTTAAAVPATAATPSASGFTCGTSITKDVTTPHGWIAELDGGPLVAADLQDSYVPTGPVTITLECSLVEWPMSRHSDPKIVSASATGTEAVVLPPTPARWVGTLYDQNAALCTHVTLTDAAGTTDLYLDQGGEWSVDANSNCEFATWCECPPQEIWDVVCPVLATVFPPDGDIPPNVLDCLPYD